MLAHLLHDVGPLVGRQPFEDLRGALGLEVLKDRPRRRKVGWSTDLDRARQGEHRHHGRGLDDGQLVDEIRQVGGRQVRDLFADPDEALVEPQPDALQKIFGRGHRDLR